MGFILGYVAHGEKKSADVSVPPIVVATTTTASTTTVPVTTTMPESAPCRRPTGPVNWEALDAMTRAGLTSDDIVNLYWSACG